tara:strand:- start:235 stop:486 length:252 start_codon:yes stop_codon:yes gene_type:complete
MKSLLLPLLAALAFMTPLYSCPIEGEDKYQILSELCNIGYEGKWESNRLNEMIILANYEKLPPEGTKKGHRTLAALTCEFGFF